MPARRQQQRHYEGLEEKAARGEYELVDPLDYMILGFLNDEGTMFANYYPEAHSGRQIIRDLFGGQLPSTIVAPRFTLLKRQRLIVNVNVPAGGQHYQRTALGKRVYDQWAATKKEAVSGQSE